MTKEENLYWLNKEIERWEDECQSKHPIKEALYAARKALEQEPFMNKACVSSKVCEHDKEAVLDKIRAEINVMSGDIETIADVLAIIDKYKAESEG